MSLGSADRGGRSDGLVVPFALIESQHSQNVGGKAAALAAMARIGMPIPAGFVITASAYQLALRECLAVERLRPLLRACGSASPRELDGIGHELRAVIGSVAIPQTVRSLIASAYETLASHASETPAVAVRSSALCEDGSAASFAGEYETYLDISGIDAVLHHIQCCWQSLFSVRALTYAREAGIAPEQIAMAVVVQTMTRARSAGVLFTLSPKSGDRSRIYIESSWGLGLSVVGGEVTPDQFSVDKISGAIIERSVNRKTLSYRFGHVPQAVPEEFQERPSLSDEEVLSLAQHGRELERYYGHPVDVEWAIEETAAQPIRILQCRPETAWSRRREISDPNNARRLSSLLIDMASKLKSGGGNVEPG